LKAGIRTLQGQSTKEAIPQGVNVCDELTIVTDKTKNKGGTRMGVNAAGLIAKVTKHLYLGA